MAPDTILDMTALLITFGWVGVAFALVGIGTLIGAAAEDQLRRERLLPRVQLSGAAVPRVSAAAPPPAVASL
jgi:hypothetical protein